MTTTKHSTCYETHMYKMCFSVVWFHKSYIFFRALDQQLLKSHQPQFPLGAQATQLYWVRKAHNEK